VGCGRRRAGCGAGGAYAANYNYNNAEFMDYEEDEKMVDEDEETQDVDIWHKDNIISSQSIISSLKSSKVSSKKIGGNKRHAKSRFEQPLAPSLNPYRKKTFPCEVELSSNLSWLLITL